MAAKNTPSSKPSPSRSSGRTRPARTAPVAIREPRPWGWIAATVAAVAFAVVVIWYALAATADNIRTGDVLPGVETFEIASAEHVPGPVEYEQTPPVGGPHSAEWADCSGIVYADPIPNENAVHGLEHGAVWVTYSPDLPAADVEALAAEVAGNPYTMMSPYEGQGVPVSLQAWGSQLQLESVDIQQVKDFMNAYKAGPNTPEPGASCTNPTFATVQGGVS